MSGLLVFSNRLICFLRSFYLARCVFRLNPATIPAGKRPPFRWEKGQHSDSIAATIPTKKASVQ